MNTTTNRPANMNAQLAALYSRQLARGPHEDETPGAWAQRQREIEEAIDALRARERGIAAADKAIREYEAAELSGSATGQRLRTMRQHAERAAAYLVRQGIEC